MPTITPQTLDNTTIQKLGQDYQQEFGKDPGCFFIVLNILTPGFSNHTMAARMVAYNSTSSVYEKWLFLANLYAQLPTNNGPLAHKVRNLFSTAFNYNFLNWKQISPNTFQQASTQDMADEFKTMINKYFANENRILLSDDDQFVGQDNTSETSKLL